MKYFDFAATCPLDREAADVFLKTSTEYYGNTQSLHDIGSMASSLLDHCRSGLARLLGVKKEGLFFTSGGSESNFLAIHSLLTARKKNGRHIISGQAEHSSIHSTLKRFEQDGYEVTYLPFNSKGQIEIEHLKTSIRKDTILISIQHANPEIGTIQPIEEIGAICKENAILFHCDCVQTFGKIDLQDVIKLIDSFSISGHKFYGPKGIGAVYVSPLLAWETYYPGAAHERGFRPGTVNVPAIAAMAAAAQKAYGLMPGQTAEFTRLRTIFKQSINEIADQVTIHEAADSKEQLPSIIGLRIKGVEGQWMMLECSRSGYAISTGTACQTGLQAPSNTMLSLGVATKDAKEFIRISFGRSTNEEDVRALAKTIVKIVLKQACSA